MWKDMRYRLLTIAVAVPLVIGILVIGGPLFYVGVVVLAVIAALEVHAMLRAPAPFFRPILIGTTLTLMLATVEQDFLLLLAALLFLVVLDILDIVYGSRGTVYHHLFRLLGALYVGLPLGAVIGIRDAPDGFAWLMVLLLNNWTNDSLALLGGRLLGKHLLAPAVSPKKTVEGAITGVVSGFAVGMLTAAVADLPLDLAAAVSLAVAFLVPLGDLLESALKRAADVKDSGSIFPGHGGALDRLDGTLLAAVAVFLILML